MPHSPRIAIAGLGTESSTFSLGRTDAEAFHPYRGEGVYDFYDFFEEGGPVRSRAEWLPTMVGKAISGPRVAAEAYRELSAELLERLAALGPIDALYLDLHGAMSVEGMDDAEGDLITRIRAVIGRRPLVSASMDLHGNVSPVLAHASDLITCYRMAPHEDAMLTKRRAVTKLLDRLESQRGRPLKAWIPVPVLLPGEKTSTRVEPARSLYARVPEVEARPGVVDAAIWIGYAWADEPRCHAVVMVTGDDAGVVGSSAEELARAFWSVRDEFDFVGPTASFEEALDRATAEGAAAPFFLSDSGDNPTAGGSGDTTWALHRILAHERARERRVIYASIPDPGAIEEACRVGLGGRFHRAVGALVDDTHAGPVQLDGIVTALREGDRLAGDEAVVAVGSVSVVLTRHRKPYHLERDFTQLGLDPRGSDIVVVKIGYLEPQLHDMAADWILALTPGGVDQDLVRLGHRRIRRPMHPYDAFPTDPDLRVRWIPAADLPLPEGLA